MTSALHVVWLLVACAFAARLMVAGLAAEARRCFPPLVKLEWAPLPVAEPEGPPWPLAAPVEDDPDPFLVRPYVTTWRTP